MGYPPVPSERHRFRPSLDHGLPRYIGPEITKFPVHLLILECIGLLSASPKFPFRRVGGPKGAVHRWVKSWTETTLEEQGIFMEPYTRLGTLRRHNISTRLTAAPGGSLGTLMSDLKKSVLCGNFVSELTNGQRDWTRTYERGIGSSSHPPKCVAHLAESSLI